MNDKHLVTQSNKLINSHYDLSLSEQKIILTLISLIQPTDKDFKPYEFKISEFIKLLGIQDQSKYIEIPKITKALMQKVFEIKEGKRTLQVAWICSALHDSGTGTVTLKIAPELKPYLLELKGLFTSFSLEYILRLTSKYSIRLYEILKSYEYQQAVEIGLSELANMLKLSKGYSDYAQIKRRIIEPSQKEIAEKTDIMFDYETVTVRKKVVALKFTIKLNPKNKSPKLIQEAPKQLKEPDSNTQPSQLDDVKTVKAEFQRLYKGELVDKFVEKMLAEKGFEHVKACIKNYADYINGRDISNIAGDFYRFVMEGYQEPTSYKGKKTQRDNFIQREYSREECEKWEQAFWDEPALKQEPKNYTYINDESIKT